MNKKNKQMWRNIWNNFWIVRLYNYIISPKLCITCHTNLAVEDYDKRCFDCYYKTIRKEKIK